MRTAILVLFALFVLASCKKADEKDCRETCLAYVGETPGAQTYGRRAGSAQEGNTFKACIKVCMEKGAPAVLGFATNRATRPLCEESCRHFNLLKREAGEQATEVGMIFGTSFGSHNMCVQSCLGGATKETIRCILESTEPRGAQLCVVR
jgi:hypothetical protein